MKAGKRIAILTREHAEQVFDLRSVGFSNAKGFTAHPDVSRWTGKDDFFYNLGAFHGSTLVSVMRLDWAFDPESVAYKLNCRTLPKNLVYPIGVLVKASTTRECMGEGLNALLRYWSLKIAVQCGVKHVMGTMVSGSPRVNSMIEMGYAFTKNPDRWSGYYHTDDEVLVATLDLEKRASQAFSFLEKLLAEKLNEYRIEFDLKGLKLKPLPKAAEARPVKGKGLSG